MEGGGGGEEEGEEEEGEEEEEEEEVEETAERTARGTIEQQALPEPAVSDGRRRSLRYKRSVSFSGLLLFLPPLSLSPPRPPLLRFPLPSSAHSLALSNPSPCLAVTTENLPPSIKSRSRHTRNADGWRGTTRRRVGEEELLQVSMECLGGEWKEVDVELPLPCLSQ